MTDSISIKGIRQGVLVSLSEDGDWDTVVTDLATLIEERGRFFKGARWVIDIKDRPLGNGDLVRLQDQLDLAEVELVGILATDPETLRAAETLALPTSLDAIPELEPEIEEEYVEPLDSEEYGTGGVLIKRTLRNGRTVRSGGHVVVIGDVNNGAEIVAVGDIVVWGKLRGIVHAGAEGDESAVVCALDLAPTQLRIASLISIPPKENKRRKPRPEIARVIDGQIEAMRWDG